MKQYLKDLGPKEIIENLKKGLSIECDDTSNKYFMIDGIICCLDFEGELYINSGIPCNEEEWYFKIEEPFKITRPGFYKTRLGKKVYISIIKDKPKYKVAYGLVEGDSKLYKYDIDGTCQVYDNDLISIWED